MSELRDASVLVTGASGFLGGRFTSRLAGRCRRVVAMARGAATVVHPVLAHADIIIGDVLVPNEIERALHGIDVVVHFAGHSGARSSAEDPLHDLHANVGGIVTLLEAIRKTGRPMRVVFPGSRLEYGTAASLPAREDQPMRPLSPYGLNKYACEQYLELYSRLYGISYAVARLTNPYGPWVTRAAREYNVFNNLIATAQAGGTLTVYGDGSQLRDYVYVDDVVDALLLLAGRTENIVVNVGSGTGISFRNAVETIVRVAKSGRVESVPWPPDAQRLETGDFVADVTRLRELGWAPRTALDEGIRATLESNATG